MAVQIPADIESRIEAFANQTGESKDDLVRDALLGYLEDRQDAIIAAERLKNAGGRTSLEELSRKYGVPDCVLRRSGRRLRKARQGHSTPHLPLSA